LLLRLLTVSSVDKTHGCRIELKKIIQKAAGTAMRYEGTVIRPPSEAYSLIVQVTIGCSHNKCTFCGTFKNEKFRFRALEEVMEDLRWAIAYYRMAERIFLADADVLVLKTDYLVKLLDNIHALFPECNRVSSYATAQDVLRKTPEDLALLKARGLGMLYLGAETGNREILKSVRKGSTREELIEAVHKIGTAGMRSSVTFISGLGGRNMWREHAVDTGTIISEMEPDYASLLTLIVDPCAPLSEDVKNGTFVPLTPEEVLEETKLLVETIHVKKRCVFRSNHASNYLPLRGTLPEDKDALLRQIASAGVLRPERYRML
jgi:radical SAM superfamily enzyme YgiQ (UPF0313 family)